MMTAQHDECAAHIRQAIGDRAYDAAFERGTGLGLDDAVGYAAGPY